MQPNVSVVIVTLNRASWLSSVLSALRHQNYSPFEIIVVNGPSTDNTEEVLATHAEMIRVGRCLQHNLSTSRNIGIEMAEGEFVAFLDDDAVPDENWIADLVAGFDSPEVAGTGGTVYDSRFNCVQYHFCVANRLGEARFDLSTMPPCYPGASQFPYMVGCNCMYRRDLLIKIGGFDQEYDYYLDETDVCVRLVDAGYRLRKLANAVVYHASAPGPVRNSSGVVTKWYPILKNKLYFSLKHTPEGFPWHKIMQNFETSVTRFRQAMEGYYGEGRATRQDLETFYADVEAARRDGIRAGLCPHPPALAAKASTASESEPAGQMAERRSGAKFRTVPVILDPGEKLTVCLLSQGYLPDSPGGIARRTYEIACGLAELGHTVHVLTKSGNGGETVSYEEQVWVHRLASQEGDASMPPDGLKLDGRLWRYSHRLLEELRSIQKRKPIDIVDGSVWDSEGLAAILSGEFCTVTTIETPLKMNLLTNPDWAPTTPERGCFYEALIRGEILATTRATAVRAVSSDVLHTMESLYDLRFDPERVFVTPNGLKDRYRELRVPAAKEPGSVNVLFVGRFESRKGIDVLLQVIPRIASRFPQVRFTIAGGDSPNASARIEDFHARNPGLASRERVSFAGKVSDEVLDGLLAGCDIFVAPSLYESFGLVYLEAMMFGKPVVACRTGGVPDVVQNGVNGLLAVPGDPETLYECLAALIENPNKRSQYGAAGRQLFLANFTREKFVERTQACYRQALRLWKGAPGRCGV